jgi:hypothetical protein
VNARVRPSGAADVDFSEDLSSGTDQMTLHRFLRVTLRLPS